MLTKHGGRVPKEMTVSNELNLRREIGGYLREALFDLGQDPAFTPGFRETVLNLCHTWDDIPQAKDPFEEIKLNASKDQLRQLMSEISEDHYCAGWLSGLEQDLWARAFLGDADKLFGLKVVEALQLEKLRVLAHATDSWWVFAQDIKDKVCITFDEACKRFGDPI